MLSKIKDFQLDFGNVTHFFTLLVNNMFLRYIQHRVNCQPSQGTKYAPTTPNPTFTHIDFFRQ